ncbi:MAG: hypothetical protein ACK56I_28225, partial [bacterium]
RDVGAHRAVHEHAQVHRVGRQGDAAADHPGRCARGAELGEIGIQDLDPAVRFLAQLALVQGHREHHAGQQEGERRRGHPGHPPHCAFQSAGREEFVKRHREKGRSETGSDRFFGFGAAGGRREARNAQQPATVWPGGGGSPIAGRRAGACPTPQGAPGRPRLPRVA